MPSRFYAEDLALIHAEGYSKAEGALADALLDLCAKAGIRDGQIVDLGCGHGGVAKRFSDRGYRVLGIDVSPPMIKLARNLARKGSFRVGSIWQAALPRCRLVTALGEVLCYRKGSKDPRPRSLFEKVYDALEPGGLFVFDVAEVGLDRRRPPAFVEEEDWACLVRYEYDDRRDRLTRHITTFRRKGKAFRKSRERHVLQLFEARELASTLRQVGFKVRTVRRLGRYQLLPKRVGFIARKPE